MSRQSLEFICGHCTSRAKVAHALRGAVASGLTFFTSAGVQVDDPVSAFALHGAVGAWGVLFPGFLAAPHYVVEVYGAYGFGMDAREGKRWVHARGDERPGSRKC